LSSVFHSFLSFLFLYSISLHNMLPYKLGIWVAVYNLGLVRSVFGEHFCTCLFIHIYNLYFLLCIYLVGNTLWYEHKDWQIH
jgi:hypothetical protein